MQGPYTKTVGLIVPSSDVNIEATYHRFAPPGIAVATNRIALNRLSVKNAGGDAPANGTGSGRPVPRRTGHPDLQ